MSQNSGVTPPIPNPSENNPRRRPSFLTRALSGSMVVHTAVLLAFYFWPVHEQPREILLEVDLQQPKMQVEPKPAPTPAKAQPTPKKPEAKKPDVKPTPQRVAKAPTPEPSKPKPEATKAQPQVKPQPTPEQKPTSPPKTQVAKAPVPPSVTQAKVVPTPDPGKRAEGEPTPGLKDNTTRLRQDRAPDKFAGLARQPKPGDGAPLGPGKPIYNEEAGALPGDMRPGAGRNRPGTRASRDRGSSPFDEASNNQPDTGGQNDKLHTPLPQGLPTGQRLANRNDLAPGNLSSNLYGAGRPGGGSPGNWSPSDNGPGSRDGKNPELAGTDGAGGLRDPRARARRGGGGGPDTHFAVLPRNDPDAVAVDSGAPGLTPGAGGGAGGGRGGGAGRFAGAGVGNQLSGPNRAALNVRPGAGLGAGKGNGVGGAPGSGRSGGDIAGGGGGTGGGFGRGRGSGYGDGRGGSGGGGGGRKGRIAGDPFGVPNGSRTGNPDGGGGKGGGPGGPGSGPRLAMGGGAGPGDGKGDGAGRGRGGNGNGFGDGPGRGAGGFGRGPGSGGGNGSGDGGAPGIGGGNGGGGGGRGNGGRGGRDGAGSGDDEAGPGRGIRGRPLRGRPGAKREGDSESDIGRGIWGGFRIQFYQDTAKHPDYPDATFHPGHKIDWPVFTKPIKTVNSSVLNYDWGIEPPAPGMKFTFWSMKAMGRIFVPKDDTYEFYFDELDDAGRLYLDGKKVIEVWMVQKSTPSSGKHFLKRGAHDLVIEYVQGPATAASIKLAWKSSSFPKEIVGVYKPPEER